jgi:hypothetical protein
VPTTPGEVVINTPEGPPRVATGRVDRHGQPIEVSCSTCHSSREPDPSQRVSGHLQAFHKGLVIQHGTLSCLSCHGGDDYDALRLADGTAVPFPEVMTLCGQCHGPQKRDYDHGSHGGMQGYWDLSKGGRTRNVCTDCHDPHAPAYPQVRPVFPPVKEGH